MHATKLAVPIVLALASFACASPRQEWPGPGPQPPPAPIPSVVAPPMPEPRPIASESSSSSTTSPDLAPVDSATAPTTPPAPTAKPRHQEAASFTARGASQALACDQAKRGADSAALNKCGAGHALDKNAGQCTCSGGTAVASCTVTVTVMCEDK